MVDYACLCVTTTASSFRCVQEYLTTYCTTSVYSSTYIKIESSRLDYICNHQDDIRADLYQGLVDILHAGEGRAEAVGKRIVMPSLFIGGPRDMRRRYMDAMALV